MRSVLVQFRPLQPLTRCNDTQWKWITDCTQHPSKWTSTWKCCYVGDIFDVSPKLSLYAGLRYSFYNYLGLIRLSLMLRVSRRALIALSIHWSYKSGKSIINYGGPEYRLSVKYLVSSNASIKFSYNRMRQYLQMLSTQQQFLPDIWKLSDPIQTSDWWSGSSWLLPKPRSNTIEVSAEAYYKLMQNSIDTRAVPCWSLTITLKLILWMHVVSPMVLKSAKKNDREGQWLAQLHILPVVTSNAKHLRCRNN